jgi:hypothetical protein
MSIIDEVVAAVTPPESEESRRGARANALAAAGAKANLGELEYLDPWSQEYLDKLEHIRGAVLHHMYEEENDRFLDLKDLPLPDQSRLTHRFKEEFDRYVRGPSLPAEESLGRCPAPSAV